MRNSNKTILILILLILLCGGAYYFLLLRPSETVTEDALFEEAELREVDEITVTGTEFAPYCMIRSGDTYALDEDSDISLSEAYLAATWQRLTGIEAAYRVESAGSMTEMGFDSPYAIITYRRGNEEVLVLEIGRYVSARDGYYARRAEEKSGIYLIDAERITEITEARQEFYIKNLIDFYSEDDFDRLASVEVTGRDADFIPVKIEADNTWFHMSKPINYICDYKILKSTFLDPIVHLKGTQYVPGPIDASMGFDDPNYTITYVYDGREIKVLVGNSTGDMTYLSQTESNLIFLTDNENLDFLKEDYRELIGGSCYSRYINFVDSFTVEYQGRSEKFDLYPAEDYSDKWYAVNNGREYAYEEFIGLYNAVMGVARNQMAEGGKETDPDKGLRIEVKLKSGDTDLVEFRQISDREYEAVVNGECHFTALASSVETILSKLNSLLSD